MQTVASLVHGESPAEPSVVTAPREPQPARPLPTPDVRGKQHMDATVAASIIRSEPLPIAGGSTPSTSQGMNVDMDVLKRMVADQVESQAHKAPVHRDSQAFPDEYMQAKYPIGYTIPKFQHYTGTGNPDQHLMHFKINCGDTICDERLLLRQFVRSLSGIAFEWFSRLEPGSIKTFPQLEDAFRKRFDCGLSDRVTLQQLTEMKPEPNEAGPAFIQRWRESNMRCHQPIEER